MNYKEYFKEQLFEAIMEDTFAERQASHGDDAAIEKAKYFKGLMSRLEDRKAQAAADREGGGPASREYAAGRAREHFTGLRRVRTMAGKHMGNHPSSNDPNRDGDRPSFKNPVMVGEFSPKEQKDDERRARVFGEEERNERAKSRAEARGAADARAAAAAREKKFTI